MLPRLRPSAAPLFAAVLLCALVLRQYAIDPAAPGMRFPEGWWGWFDQGKTLLSAESFLGGDLRPQDHWYPLGYALLGAPFLLVSRYHGFLPLDLICLTLTFWAAFRLARRMGFGPVLAALVLLLGMASDTALRADWSVPWNTAPAAALMWGLLASGAAQAAGRRRAFGIGLCLAGLAACRPTDVVTTVPALLLTAWAARNHPRRWTEAGLFVLGGALVAVPYALLHLAIYGPAPSEYMVISRQVGFTLFDFPWRAYVLLIDPTEWFSDGQGLLHHYPWLVLGLAALPLAVWHGTWAARLLAVTLLAHLLLYICYVDLLPTGFWRYLNIHYFTWAMPGYALLSAALLRDIGRPGARRAALACLAVVLLVSTVRLKPVPVSPDRPAKMVDFAGPVPPFNETYFAVQAPSDNVGPLTNISLAREMPFPGGLRVVALRRNIVGRLTWPAGPPPGVDAGAAQTAYGVKIGMGWPRWLRDQKVHSVLP